MLVQVQTLDPYEHFQPFLLAQVQRLDLYEHLGAYSSILIKFPYAVRLSASIEEEPYCSTVYQPS